MSKQLVVIRGMERGRVLALGEDDILQFGCSQNLEIQCRLRDPGVARVHCEIKVDGDRVTVIDAKTGHGTFLNGQPITQQDLRSGDVIRLGETELRFCSDTPTRPDTVVDCSLVSDTALGTPPLTTDSLPALKSVDTDVLRKLVGKAFAQFKIEVEVGAGLWGRVFRAHDTRADRTVALKVLCPEFSQEPEMMEQFRHAVKLVTRLRHPHLVLHHGAGTAGRFCWISMEYVEGRSLTQLVRRAGMAGLPDWRQALDLAFQLGQVLQLTHKHGAIHGHITPQNILMSEDGKPAKLGDLLFAFAQRKRNQPIPPWSDRFDELGHLAPERIDGAEEADARTDIYGVGAVAYSLLTGKSPCAARSWDDTIQKVRQTPPIKPVFYQPNVPELLERAFLKMLAKQPAERYQNVAELLADLQEVRVRHATGVSSLRSVD